MSLPVLLEWSEQYFHTLTPNEHRANNVWFHHKLNQLKDDGVLIVPVIGKSFNKQGQEIN